MGGLGEILAQLGEQVGQRKRCKFDLHRLGFQPGNVQQPIQQVLHGPHRVFQIANQLARLVVMWQLRQAGHKHAQGMCWLAQVVTGRRQKARLGLRGLLGLFLFLTQSLCRGVNLPLQFFLYMTQALGHFAQVFLQILQWLATPPGLGLDIGRCRKITPPNPLNQVSDPQDGPNHATAESRCQHHTKDDPKQADQATQQQHVLFARIHRLARKFHHHLAQLHRQAITSG